MSCLWFPDKPLDAKLSAVRNRRRRRHNKKKKQQRQEEHKNMK